MVENFTGDDGVPYSTPVDGCECGQSYANTTLLNTVFGTDNVTKWADVDDDGDATKISDRLAWALCIATSTLDSRLQDSIYAIPFSNPVPCVVQDACARLAGVMLYDARRIADVQPDSPQYSLSPHRKYVQDFIRNVRCGKVRLPVPQIGTTIPQVETPGACGGYQGYVNGYANPDAYLYLPFIWRPVVLYPAPFGFGACGWL